MKIRILFLTKPPFYFYVDRVFYSHKLEPYLKIKDDD